MTDIANRLSEDDQFTYVYDANGNLTSKTAKAGGAVTGYNYDAQDQLTRIDFPDPTFAAYRYDGLGRRIEKDVNGTVTQYVYDRSDILAEFDGAASLLARYSHGHQVDQPLAVERDLDSSGSFEAGEQFYYQADHQGSLRRITDSSGAVANSYDYDAYGNIEASVEAVSQPYTYTGREQDAESGLYYYRARYYDPATGRFINQDPIGFTAGDLNLYRYVFNNPVNFKDPSGEIVPLIIAPIAACLGSVACGGGIVIGSGIALTCLSNPAACTGLGGALDKLFNSAHDDAENEGAGAGAGAGASGESCPEDDEFCEKRWKRENGACTAWIGYGMDKVRGCQRRASARLASCRKNGGSPADDEPDEWGLRDILG